MKLVSWNVNGIRAAERKELSKWLKKEKPDIFCVQETKAHKEQVEDAVKSLGYEYHEWSSAVKKGYSGTATFTNLPVLSTTKGIKIPDYDSEGRFVITEFKDFDLYNIYFPNGGSGEVRHLFKQSFLSALLKHIQGELKRGKNVIVVGDYNIAHKDIDVHDPVRLAKHSGFLPEERQWLTEFFDLGFIDTFRHFHPDVKDKYSWWDMRQLARISNRGWRIDYISISKGLLPRLKKAEVLDDVEGSDHAPVMIELS